MSIFDALPAPWTVDDNRSNHEGELTVFADNGEVVLCAGDMEDVEAVDIALANAVATLPELLTVCEMLIDTAGYFQHFYNDVMSATPEYADRCGDWNALTYLLNASHGNADIARATIAKMKGE